MPARHRDSLAAGCDGRLTLTRHPDGCVLVYPRPTWEVRRQQIAELPYSARALQRLLLGSAVDVELDSAGRILVSAGAARRRRSRSRRDAARHGRALRAVGRGAPRRARACYRSPTACPTPLRTSRSDGECRPHLPPDAQGHRSVLAAQAVAHLVTDPDGTYVDATFGRGGHSTTDPAAARPGRPPAGARSGSRRRCGRSRPSGIRAFTSSTPPFHAWRRRLRRTESIECTACCSTSACPRRRSTTLARGFSWRGDGPLDMRMDTTRGETAAQWLARASIDELTRVIRDYGEERFAASIAKALVARREAGRPVASTGDLAAVVAGAIARKSRADGAQHPATRTFQAVRIHVNQELEELALALEQAARRLRTGGRLVVISFHSLEDRIVKRFIDAHAHPGRPLPAERGLPLRAPRSAGAATHRARAGAGRR